MNAWGGAEREGVEGHERRRENRGKEVSGREEESEGSRGRNGRGK